MNLGTGRLRGAAAVFVVLLTALTITGQYRSATAAPAEDSSDAQGRTMLLLDSSGSMAEGAGGGKTKIQAAKSALRTVVKGLPPEAEVGLRVFGAKVFSRKDPGSCEDSQVVVEPGTDNRDDLLGEIDKYKPYGETPIPHALREAAKDLGSEGVRSIVLVSDGESTCDPDPCKVAEDLAEDGIDLRIDVVGLSVSGKARDQLKCIAKSGNGDYFDADDAGDIEATLTRVAKRAVQPFTLQGTPISGGTQEEPTEITAGNWVDSIGEVDDWSSKYYAFERTQAGTTLRVAALTQGGRGYNDVTRVEIVNAEGRRCGYASVLRSLDTRTVNGAKATAGKEGDCDAPGIYTIKVTRGSGDPAVEVGLRVTEEPAVEADGFVGTALDDVVVGKPAFEGTAQEVAGTASFGGAPELTSGLWSSDIVAGEALIYRFRLEHGQSASVGMRFPTGTPAHRKAFGWFLPLARMTLHDPLGANVGFPDDAVFSERVAGDKPTLLRTATPEVSRVSGTGGGKFDGGGDFTVAGDYYLMIAVQRSDTVELPFEIDLQIQGEPADGPTYVDDASWTADGTGESPDEESTAADEEEAADDESGNTLLMAVGVGAGVLVAGALVVFLVLRRRRATT